MSQPTTSKIFRFLIVDDSRAIQSIIRRALESCGYPNTDIRTANDGESAFSILEEFTPDLIITDWHMPKVTGIEFCQQVRQIYEGRIPIGFVTTESSQEKLDTARRYGASFIINKPFEDADFKNVVLGIVPHSVEEFVVEVKKPIAAMEVNTDILCAKLKGLLPNQAFNLTPTAPIALSQLSDTNLIGLYGFGDKPLPVGAVGIMDMSFVSLLWAIHNQHPITALKDFVQKKQLDDQDLKPARDYLTAIAEGVTVHRAQLPLFLSRSNIVNRQFPRLEMAFKTNDGRADYMLSIPNWGDALFSFVLLPEA